jgi:hypothetical protein
MGTEGRERLQTRAAARRMLVQALYQWQLVRQPAEELVAQYAAAPEFARVDRDYFREAIAAICSADARIDESCVNTRHPARAARPGRACHPALGIWNRWRDPRFHTVS